MALSNGNTKKYSTTKDLLSEEQQDVLKGKGNKIERLQSEITHLSKPLLQTEGSLQWSKHVTPGTLSVFQDEKSWHGIQIDVNRKSNIREFKDANGLSWSNMRESMHLDSEDESASEEGSPVTTRLNAKDMQVFGSMPMEEDIVVVKCNNCHRPLLPSKFKEHSESCIGKQDFFSDEKKVFSLEDELSIPTAKRPPSASLEKVEKKKLKKEKQKKTTKQKALSI
ncbi:uncharacterized protein B0P05DRAFT_203532 [Gilbertella persicaria]|uniref:uncharacterized protein n=1 Tax=Gilbertella persicaria TaxID=101096 RepID=UPI002221192D|nr:uncharacterized protein B0P05DRAFT_203532 [Gilbertella persicaria]KAI8067705.1 hypothetical protein B0P05DRAFT_203532 [Gilbertella persicaria]